VVQISGGVGLFVKHLGHSLCVQLGECLWGRLAYEKIKLFWQNPYFSFIYIYIYIYIYILGYMIDVIIWFIEDLGL
jgi:hypothetical protein